MGVSVSRWKITTPRELLTEVGGKTGSKIAIASVWQIRQLGFCVEPQYKESDPGYAWIENGTKSLDEHADRKILSQVFVKLDEAYWDLLQPENFA